MAAPASTPPGGSTCARGRAVARIATPDERRRYWPLLLQVYPPYSRYQARTDREIPLVILQPIDAELSQHLPTLYQQTTVEQRPNHASLLIYGWSPAAGSSQDDRDVRLRVLDHGSNGGGDLIHQGG